jgi:histidinol-phosphatase (PHP family)
MQPEEVKGRRCFELIGRNRQCDICATEKALRSKKLERVEKYLPEQDRYLDCRSYPVLDDDAEVIFIVEQISDITERRRAEEETKRLATEYETVFNGTHDCIFLIRVTDDGKFRFIRNNLAHENATGLTTEMLHQKTPEELLGEQAGSVVSANYQRCLDTKGTIIYEETLNLPAGEKIWETLLTPVIRDDIITHIVGSSRDITNQKQIEMELRLSEERYRDFFDKPM